VAFQIYKAGQGRYVRVPTAVGMGLVGAVLVYYTWVLLARYVAKDMPVSPFIIYGIPALLAVGLALLGIWMLNKVSFVDFLIATEGEMKKVSWSSRPELIGSTIVVIATVVLLAAVIWVFDTAFIAGLTYGLHLW
jgi:preprotein translocase subunit SecE